MEGEMGEEEPSMDEPVDDEREAQQMVNRRAQNNQVRQRRKRGKPKKKAIKTMSHPRHNPYSYLKQLPMSLIEKKEHQYHNNTSDTIRRNENWKQAVVLSQKRLFTFGGDMVMLARVHFTDFKVA